MMRRRASGGQVVPRAGGCTRALKRSARRFPLCCGVALRDSVIGEVLAKTKASSVHFTRDYAPWSGALERRVKDICDAAGAGCHRYGGFLLHEPEFDPQRIRRTLPRLHTLLESLLRRGRTAAAEARAIFRTVDGLTDNRSARRLGPAAEETRLGNRLLRDSGHRVSGGCCAS